MIHSYVHLVHISVFNLRYIFLCILCLFLCAVVLVLREAAQFGRLLRPAEHSHFVLALVGDKVSETYPEVSKLVRRISSEGLHDGHVREALLKQAIAFETLAS